MDDVLDLALGNSITSNYAKSVHGLDEEGLQRQIADLKKNSETMKIKEVELRSMYNIEKEMPNFDLVGSTNVSYIELGGSMAMK